MRRRKVWAAAAVSLVTLLGLEARAGFEDMAAMAKLIAVEMDNYARLGTLIHETSNIVANVKEHTTLLKTAYKGIEDVIQMRWQDLERDVRRGLSQAFPELEVMYRDIEDIEDLRYTNTQAEQTLRDMLYKTAYGPAVEYLHQQHEDMDAVAKASETIARHTGLLAGERAAVRLFEEDCKKGEGACLVSSQRATIHQAAIMGDIHEVLIRSADMQQRLVTLKDQEENSAFYQQVRFTTDFIEHAQALLGVELRRDCRPGKCLYDAYAGSAYETMAKSRRRHPPQLQRLTPQTTVAGME